MTPLETPILFCIFNRPELTAQVFAAIRRQRPRTLLVVQDGPRLGKEGEAEQVAAARRVLDQVDWSCDVRTNFAERNLGCKIRMATGIGWGFEQSERLIILEDDCLPSDSFFGYCESLLDRFAEDNRVSMISGDNFQPCLRGTHSYYFSKWTHIWGWASWRRAWRQFDVDMADWPEKKSVRWLRELCCDAAELDFWTATFERQCAGLIDTWDFPWMYCCWRSGGLTAIPQRNLVSNLGFGSQATHTIDQTSPLANLPRFELGPLDHPDRVIRDVEADECTWRNIFRPKPAYAADKSKQRRRSWWPGVWRAAS